MSLAAQATTGNGRWYIVHVYSGFENKVAQSIREKADNQGLGEMFEQILVPTEKVVEVRQGKKYDTEQKHFPGYVLVKMRMSDQSCDWNSASLAKAPAELRSPRLIGMEMMSRMRPGRREKTRTRSARRTASSRLWVT